MSSQAIANVSNALGYDLAEIAILTPGALYSGAVTRAALMVLEAIETNDHGPISSQPTECLATVRPGRKAA